MDIRESPWLEGQRMGVKYGDTITVSPAMKSLIDSGDLTEIKALDCGPLLTLEPSFNFASANDDLLKWTSRHSSTVPTDMK